MDKSARDSPVYTELSKCARDFISFKPLNCERKSCVAHIIPKSFNAESGIWRIGRKTHRWMNKPRHLSNLNSQSILQ